MTLTLSQFLVAQAAVAATDVILEAEWLNSQERRHYRPLLRAALELANGDGGEGIERIRQAYARVGGQRTMSAGGGA